MRVALRRVSLGFLVGVVIVAWGIALATHSGTCPVEVSAHLGTWTVGIALVAAVAAGLVGSRRQLPRSLRTAVPAALVLGTWGILLLARTGYLEPLPWSAAPVAVSFLVVASFGAGLVSGWQWWTLLALPAAAVGFFHLGPSLYDTGVECEPFHPAVGWGLVLVPIAIGAGALASRLARRTPGAVLTFGAALALMPLVVFGWAGFRHARPIDRHPAHAFIVTAPPLPAPPSYRGVKIGDSRRELLARLGPPDRIIPPQPGGDQLFDYVYGDDTITYAKTVRTGIFTRRDIVYAFTIRDPRAETPEGVGIGDNLAIARRRYPAIDCFLPLGDFDPICPFDQKYQGRSGYSDLSFEDDPIETIVVGGVPPPGAGAS